MRQREIHHAAHRGVTTASVPYVPLPDVGDAHSRRPGKRRAVGVERRPLYRLIAGAADPCRVSAAVA
jgi:hypothetical protein